MHHFASTVGLCRGVESDLMNACNIHECHIHGDFLSMSKRKNSPGSQATRFCIVWQTHECQKKKFPNSAPLRSRASSARRKTLLLRLGQATVFEICLSGRCPGDFTVRKAFLIVAVKARGAWMVFRSLPRNATSRAGGKASFTRWVFPMSLRCITPH